MRALYFSQQWPKQGYSGSHSKTLSLVERLILNNYQVTFISPQQVQKGLDLKQYSEVKLYQGDPLNTNQMAQVLTNIKAPQLAIYDTFFSEEKYSHYIHHLFPNCLQILHLQSLHSLRMKREAILDNKGETQLTLDNSASQQIKQKLFQHECLGVLPKMGDPLFDREAASVIRSDMVITSSDYEDYLLKEYFPSCQDKSHIITNFYHTSAPDDQYDKDQAKLWQDFSRRKNFVFIGNMALTTNQDTVKYLVQNIWPQLKQLLPQAELHLYGQNFPKELKSNSKLGIKCQGEMTNINQLAKYKALLAPIRFGSGIKAKIADSWAHYLPVVTTPTGAEGMFKQSTKSLHYLAFGDTQNQRFFSDIRQENLSDDNKTTGLADQDKITQYYSYKFEDGLILDFGGSYSNMNDETFIQSAFNIYNTQELWEKSSQMGQDILKTRMDKQINNNMLIRAINDQMTNFQDLRKQNSFYKQTWEQTLRSNPQFIKFMSERRRVRNTQQSLQHL